MRGIEAMLAVVRTTQNRGSKLSSKVVRDYKHRTGKTVPKNVNTNGVTGYYWDSWDMYVFTHCLFEGKDFHLLTEEEWYGC